MTDRDEMKMRLLARADRKPYEDHLPRCTTTIKVEIVMKSRCKPEHLREGDGGISYATAIEERIKRMNKRKSESSMTRALLERTEQDREKERRWR